MTHDERLRAVGTTVRSTVSRISKTFQRATASDIERGSTWYAEGGELIDEIRQGSDRELSREQIAAVIAHLSPRTRWSRNVAGAVMLCAGGEPLHCMPANVSRAFRAMHSENPLGTLKGPKTRRFALNLLGDRDAVTVDMWAAKVALGHDDYETLLSRVGVYDAIEHCYQVAARRHGVDPVTMQATCWIVARNGRAD